MRAPAAGAVTTGAEGAVVSMIHVKVAGVASTLPAGSGAGAASGWSPAASPEKLTGLLQPLKVAAPSRRHSKVTLPSFDENEKVAVDWLVLGGGDVLIDVSGATVSTVKARVAGVGSW